MEHKEPTESFNTKEYAATVRVDPQTIRRSFCVNGHYLDVKPYKLPNGRLLWPKSEVLRVVGAD
jgi:hypothetical protein